MNSYKKQIQTILKNDYGVRSGVYSVIDSNIQMILDEKGEYQPVFNNKLSESTYKKLLKVDSMSSLSDNEQTISENIFKNITGIKYDSVLGYYTNLYAGYVIEGDFREKGSSGGFTSWILSELLEKGDIDGVIHARAVDPKNEDGILFKYVISRTKNDLQKGSKSYYYPMELSQVLQVVKEKPGSYAVVGIPEFITELRLLAQVDPVIKKRVKYTIGLVCGHQKTAKYAEALAWQHGIRPGDLSSIDFRVKQPDSNATDYLHRFTGKKNGKKISFTKSHAELFAENWAAGFFKSKFSDFTDNTFNETADITLGDAWLPQYDGDGMGNNIIIVRNSKIDNIIRTAIKQKRVKLDIVSKETIKESQKGLIHHTKDELPYRLARQKIYGKWVPKKRKEPSLNLESRRKQVQIARYEMATKSHLIYKEAVSRDNWSYFEKRMSVPLGKYKRLYHFAGHVDEGYVSMLRKKLRLRTRTKNLLDRLKRKLRIRTRLRIVKRSVGLWREQRRYKHYNGAILTLTGYFNYGNIIQRYALQRFLQNNSYKFVSYAREPLDTSGEEFDRLRNTARFVQRYIDRKPFDPSDNFPAYIVGSDQVWRNWEYDDEERDLGYYFFNFVKNDAAKRIAYAASFGQETLEDSLISKEFLRYSKPLVDKYRAISVREKSAVAVVKNGWSKKAEVVVDPTMLLDAQDYSGIIDNFDGRLTDTKPMFSYILAVNESKELIVDKISRSINCEVEEFYPKQAKVLPHVEQWLKGFRDAEFVVTDSFHGTVFSILNNTPFIVIDNEYGGTTRITSLLEQFGLKDRLIFEAAAKDFNVDDLGSIDWVEVNKKLKKLRQQSGSWLLEALSE